MKSVRKKYVITGLFACLFVGAGLSLGFQMEKAADRSLFLPGETTHGHYQIELRCDACHEPFGGVSNDACNKCHGAELAAANDAHPRSKFADPRNADLLEKIDASRCATCHREHESRLTGAMGVTQPADYCFHCHQDIARDRQSHAGLAFTTCATAGCHNFHDNTALYEDFVVRHLDQPAVKPEPVRLMRAAAAPIEMRLTAVQRDTPVEVFADPQLIDRWEHSGHAAAGVNCSACHLANDAPGTWVSKPGHEACARCHETEAAGFLQGRHGMRLAAGLSAMSPEEARLPMRAQSAHRTLTCSTCHEPHDVDTRVAAVDACMTCHDDGHTRAYAGSPHHRLWRAEINGQAASGSGVSCATCHLPRERHRADGRDLVRVQHNQNANLRPNEKMLRTVCLDCHGYAFALDALSDRGLVDTNFRGAPTAHVATTDMVRRRHPQRQTTQTSTPDPR